MFEARDAGVTEIVAEAGYRRARCIDRIDTVIMRAPGPSSAPSDYFGPCRRRRDDPSYDGPRRRGDERTLEL